VDDDPATHAAASERDARLRACFARLSPEHQAVLALRVMQDLPYDAIATALGVPVGTVMSRLSRARAERRRLMSEGSGESS
jgi:RNA polymerase sigma-70 factor (ECF subfamily)